MSKNLDDYEFAVFWPRVSNRHPHRGPYPAAEGLDWAREWIKDTEIKNGAKPGTFVIRERKISDWRNIDV